MNESLKIILNQFKKKNITEEEAVRLILDVTNNNYRWCYPYYINHINDTSTFTTTCSNEDNTVSKVQE